MTTANPETPSEPISKAVRGRQSRAREEELLVWPDLVFIEFICAVLFTVLILILAVMVDSILLDRANPAVTPNPSKAPWYFLNLQELLLHMHPALAGVIVPTVALIALGAIPYFDNSNVGQGEWLSTPRAWLNLWVGAFVGFFGTLLLIFYDASKHVQLFEMIANGSLSAKAPPPPSALQYSEALASRGKTVPEGLQAIVSGGNELVQPTDTVPSEFYSQSFWNGQNGFTAWPEQLEFLTTLRGIQTGIPWPEWTKEIPLGNLLRTDLFGFPRIELNVDVPALIVEQIIPVTAMIGLPVLLAVVASKLGIAKTKRDHMIMQFSGFIAVYVILTIIGTYFRGVGLELEPYTIFAHP